MLTYLILLVVLILLSGFFSSSETAFLSIQRVRLAHFVEQKVPGAVRVATLLGRPRSLLSAILLGNNLTNTAAAAVGTAIATDLVTGEGTAVILATVTVTILLVLFGEVGPKSIALGHSFELSRVYAIPIAAWVWVTRPVTVALDALGDGLMRLIGGDEAGPTTITTAELRTAIRQGAAAGSIELKGASHLLGALTLQNRQVQEIMVSRVDVVSVPVTSTLDEAARVIARSGFLRLPVFDGTPEEVVGFVHLSDLNAARVEGRPARAVKDVMRHVHYESEHASIARVLHVMQEHASYLVMLVDEFGVTSGLVTLEDILEEVVGELRSESGFEPVEAPVDVDRRQVIDGSTLLVDLEDDLGVDFSDVEANTVAGLVLFYLQRFPELGEQVTHQGVRFTVVDRDDRRVTRVALDRAPEPEEEA